MSSTQPVQPLVAAPQSASNQVTQGHLNGRPVVPAAHADGCCKEHGANVFGSLLIAIMIIAGAVLWGLNASQGGDPSMLLAGQVLTGLGLGCLVLRISYAAFQCLCGTKPETEVFTTT